MLQVEITLYFNNLSISLQLFPIDLKCLKTKKPDARKHQVHHDYTKGLEKTISAYIPIHDNIKQLLPLTPLLN